MIVLRAAGQQVRDSIRADELAGHAVRLSGGGSSLAKALNLYAKAKGDADLIGHAYSILAANPEDEHVAMRLLETAMKFG
jgi:hypothetical protein